MEPVEIEKQKVKELRHAIDELFSLLYYREHDDEQMDIETLRFEIADDLDFMETVYDDEREEIMRLIDEMIHATSKEVLPRINYQLYVRLQLLEARIDALPFSLLDQTYEEEREEIVKDSQSGNDYGANDANKVATNSVSGISRINKIDVSNVSAVINNISRINKIDVSRIKA